MSTQRRPSGLPNAPSAASTLPGWRSVASSTASPSHCRGSSRNSCRPCVTRSGGSGESPVSARSCAESAHHAHICESGRNSSAASAPASSRGGAHSLRATAATTASRSGQLSSSARGVPGRTRSSNSAVVSPRRWLRWTRAAPRPCHAVIPAASSRASSWDHATFSTRSAPPASRTGATQALEPPGSNGAEASSSQRSSSSSTSAGSSWSQALTPASSLPASSDGSGYPATRPFMRPPPSAGRSADQTAGRRASQSADRGRSARRDPQPLQHRRVLAAQRALAACVAQGHCASASSTARAVAAVRPRRAERRRHALAGHSSAGTLGRGR